MEIIGKEEPKITVYNTGSVREKSVPASPQHRAFSSMKGKYLCVSAELRLALGP